MSRGLRLAAAAAFCFAAVSPLNAADLLPPLPAFDEPLLEHQPIGAGWYLRGDVGYGSTRNGRASHTGFPIRTTVDNAKLRSGVSLGAGFGYRYNSFLRVDLTVDHRFDAKFTGSGPIPGVLFRDRANLSATTALLNAYVDLGSWGAITPYVGGGVGLSNKRFSDYTIEACLQPCGGNYMQIATLPGQSRTDFAWALMAGLAVDAGNGATVDLGYRYLNLGQARTGTESFLGRVDVRKIEAHEFRVGLRWDFGSTGY